MRRVTLLFLGYEAADFATTAIAMNMGAQELNPLVHLWGWTPLIIFKLFGILVISLMLQLKKPMKIDVIIPASIAPFIIFNAIQLVLSW